MIPDHVEYPVRKIRMDGLGFMCAKDKQAELDYQLCKRLHETLRDAIWVDIVERGGDPMKEWRAALPNFDLTDFTNDGVTARARVVRK